MITVEKDIWDTSKSRVIRVQLLTILSLLLLNAGAQVYLHHHEVRLTREKWRLLLSKPEPADIVIVGDSSAAFSLNPDKLAEKSGLKVQNFATVFQLLALGDAWIFNHYTRTIGAPKVLVVMRYIPFWELDTQETLVQALIPLPWRFWERLEPGVRTSWVHDLNFLMARYVPFYLQSNSLRKAIRFWRKGFALDGITSTGAIQVSLGPDWRFKQFDNLPNRLKWDYPFAMSELNTFALDAIFETCKRTGTTLVLVNSPVYREDAERDGYREYVKQANAALNQYANSRQNVIFLMQEPMVMEKDDLYDTIHTRESGAELVTERLHQELKQASK